MGIRSYLSLIFSEPPEPLWTEEDRREHRERVAKAKPRLAAVTRAPSREAFDAWRDNPVTQFVFAALRNAAKEQRAAWAEASWEGGIAEQTLLSELRCRADAYNSMQEGDYEAYCEWAGVEPEAEG